MSTLTGLLTDTSALFLDFDGTLAELAPRPEAVQVPRSLGAVLGVLHQQLGGALALITGRAQKDIESLLCGLPFPAAFEHGAVRINASGHTERLATPDLGPALTAARALAAQHPGLLVEHKLTAVALHYRLAPALEDLCHTTMAAAIEGSDDLQLLRGKAVVEVKSARVSKGQAIAAFMDEPPFKGRVPVFVGDDVTDEVGFAVVQRLGGLGIKVGEGPSCATHRIADPAAVRTWLQRAARLPWQDT